MNTMEDTMDWNAPQRWHDGDTFLTQGDDRVGTLLIALFAGLLSVWLLPAIRASLRQPAR